jgi:hypothetical protein
MQIQFVRIPVGPLADKADRGKSWLDKFFGIWAGEQ